VLCPYCGIDADDEHVLNCPMTWTYEALDQYVEIERVMEALGIWGDAPLNELEQQFVTGQITGDEYCARLGE